MKVNRLSAKFFMVLFLSIASSFFSFSQNIRMGGYFRFLGYVRNFQEMYDLDVPNYYSGEYPQPSTIGIGTGYREPMMMLSISGKANKNVSFGTDLMLNSPFNGKFDNQLDYGLIINLNL